MFFKYNVYEKKSENQVLLNNAKLNNIKTDNQFIGEYLAEACAKESAKEGIKCKEVNLHIGIPDDVITKLGKAYEPNEEGYVIDAGEVTNIYAETERGIIHSISTIKQLIKEGEFKEVFLFDFPNVKVRGIHYFLPGRKDFDEFKSMINDVLVPYKYNTIWFEIGGALEYKRHPKINEEWEKFAQAMLKDSGIADKLQHYTYPWGKNAIHPENGGGSYITQDEARELAEYCENRGIQVALDLPFLSHADYIVRAYPELNERVEDHDPDTYCPSNPKTYEIVFDIIDEALDVFKNSEYVSIGHDEVVTIGICDRCKDKDPVDLFIGDIKKINDYLLERGKKVIVACDKFTKLYKDGKTFEEANGEPYIDDKGKLCGGLQGFEKGNSRYVPALYTAIDKLPKNIIITDWYWNFNQFDDVFKEHQVWLSNLRAKGFKSWKERIENKINLLGFSASNWGRADYINLQRNGIIFDLVYNAHVGWNADYDDSDRDALIQNALKEQNTYYKNVILKQSADKKYITVTHTTDHNIPYHIFYDGDYVKEEDYHMGDYVVTYDDGTTHSEPVYYGENISNQDIDINSMGGAITEVSGMTEPLSIDGKTYYKWTFENLYADKEIKNIEFVSSGKFEGAEVYTKEITY